MTEEHIEVLRKLVEKGLNKIQKILIAELACNKYANVTAFIMTISSKYKLPESTIRWNVNELKQLGIIECGNSKVKGIPVSIKSSWKFLIEVLGDAHEVKGGEV
ncbi:MAG: hypothetical protein NZ893_00705 [Candidatus Aenigmarchaeota archaeon]|nr:hypothetical protein [Candidatus Aenigmarchaeota archaeon]